MSEEAKRLRDTIKLVLSAFDNARLVPKPGCGVGGQTIEANLRGSVYNGVDAWPIEEARAVLDCGVQLDRTYEWSNAAAYRAGRIAQAQEDARIADAHACNGIDGNFWGGINTASKKIAAAILANAERPRAGNEGNGK